MIGLLFKIIGDNSPFRKAMGDTKSVAASGGQDVGKAFGAQFKAGMMRFIGAGAIITAIKKQIEGALQIEEGAIKLQISPEAFQELRNAAKFLGMQIEDLQKLAPDALAEFEALMTTIRERGGIIDAAAVETLAAAADSLERLWSNMAPGVGGLVNVLNWFIEQGTAVFTALAGSWLTAVGAATNDDELMKAGREMNREAMDTPIPFGVGRQRSDVRSAANRFYQQAQANRKLAVEREMKMRAAEETIMYAPFVGGALHDMVKHLREQTAKTEQVREAIERKL